MSAAGVSDPLTSLCRLYEKAMHSVSNSYGRKRRFGGAKNDNKERPMSVIPIDLRARPAKRRRSWRGPAEQFDALLAYPATDAVPEQELRRVDEDIKRCRQQISKRSQQKRD
jgi:hypothetical protein